MKDTITYDDFLKLDIRKGSIETVEAVPKSKKLLKLSVNFGSEVGVRTIMAGIAGCEQYGKVVDGVWQDSSMVGQAVLAVINLAPRTMMGVESHGMLLAGHSPGDELEPGEKVWLATLFPVPNGTEIG